MPGKSASVLTHRVVAGANQSANACAAIPSPIDGIRPCAVELMTRPETGSTCMGSVLSIRRACLRIRLESMPVSAEVRATAASATAAQVVPANRLTDLEHARTLRVVNSPDVVNLPPLQIYARLLDDGIYIGSVSTIYRILAENR